jgi:DeoR family transcriptional regulator, aga operon transcriptional repressor
MIAEERRATLLQALNQNGYIQVAEFADEIGISAATIRRDLFMLEKEGLCIRKRGGAVRASNEVVYELPYTIKQYQHVEEKARIARAAVGLLEPGDSIIFDAGSTTYAVAQLLSGWSQLTVVTNDLQIAVRLAANPNIQLITTGGSVRPYVFSLQGWQTEAFIKSLKVKKTFLGADAIDSQGFVLNTNMDEVGIKQAMIEAAEQVILVTDSTKFGKSGMFRVCDLSEVDLVITDNDIPGASLDLLVNKKISYRLV